MGSFALYSFYRFWALYSTFMKFAFSLVVPLEFFLYFVTALKNPGIICRSVPTFGKGKITCRDCLTTETDKAFHCDDCGICIKGHDHHCIWSGQCIGEGNFTWFILFVACTPAFFVTLFMGSLSVATSG